MSIVLHRLPGEFAIAHLAPNAPAPAWAGSPVFSTVTRTADELSILCPAGQIPADVKHERGWALLKFQGPFAFTQTGVLASVLAPLAEARIGILAVSTFETDYLLVKSAEVEPAINALIAAGHSVER